jgi:YVTN family beta-propeller protein
MYVSNYLGNNVSIIDVATQTIVGSVTVGDQPQGLALAGTGMYVTNYTNDNINIIDINTQTVVGSVSVGNGPYALALAGTSMYVANAGSDNVSIIDITSQTVVGSITVGDSPQALALAGTRMYVANSASNNVNIIDINTQTVVDSVTVGNTPYALALAGTSMYVANTGSNNVNIIDINTQTVVGSVTVGDAPQALALAGTNMYVTNLYDNNINIIDINTRTITNTVAVGDAPIGLALVGTGMYVANNASNTVNIIDINTQTVSGTVTDFFGPTILALASPPPPPPPQPSLISTSGLHGNIRKTADYINASGDSSLLIHFSNLSFDQTVDAMNATCPSRNHASFLSSEFVLQIATRSIATHLRQSQNFFAFEPKTDTQATAFVADANSKIPCKAEEKQNTINVWGLNTAQYAHLKESLNNNPSLGFFSDTTMLGVDYQTKERMLVGGLVGYSHIHNHQGNNRGNSSSNLYMASLYADLFWQHLYFSPGVLGAFDTTEQMRRVKFTDFDKKAHSDLFAWFVEPHVEIGYEVVCKDIVIAPFSLLDWTFGWQRGYDETGASPFNEEAPAQKGSLLRSETGLRLFQHLCYGWGDVFFTEKASYVFEKPFSAGNIQTGFAGTPGTFSVVYADHPLNLGAIGFDTVFSFGKKNPTQLRLSLEGEAGSRYWSCQGAAELAHKF